MNLRAKSFIIILLLGLLGNNGILHGQNGGSPPAPLPPPPPPGLPIDGAIPVALVVALFIGIKKNLNN